LRNRDVTTIRIFLALKIVTAIVTI